MKLFGYQTKWQGFARPPEKLRDARHLPVYRITLIQRPRRYGSCYLYGLNLVGRIKYQEKTPLDVQAASGTKRPNRLEPTT